MPPVLDALDDPMELLAEMQARSPWALSPVALKKEQVFVCSLKISSSRMHSI